MNKGCSPLLVIIQKSDAKEQWGKNVLQKMFLCSEVEFIVYLLNLTKFISHIHNLIRGYIYPRILPRKLHNSFPLSLFPRLEKQSWVAFVPRERKNNVTAVEIWRSWNLRRRSRFTPLTLPPPIALQFEKKKDLRSKIVFKHIYFLHDITDLKGGSCFTRLPDLNLYFLLFPPIVPSTRNVSLFDQPKQFCFSLLGSHLVPKTFDCGSLNSQSSEPFMALNLPSQIAICHNNWKETSKKTSCTGKMLNKEVWRIFCYGGDCKWGWIDC